MKRIWKKGLAGILLVSLLMFLAAGCGGKEPLAETAAKGEDSDAWISTENEEDYIDVDSVEEEAIDYSRYEEKKTKRDAAGSGNENITYSDGKGGQDEYQTGAVPEGMQNPVEPGDIEINTDHEQICYLTISCKPVLDNMGELVSGKEGLIPADGIIYATQEVVFYEGESVFDVLQRETRNNRIHMEYSFNPLFNSSYIEAIHNLYEFDCGSGSGWMYSVNGWFPNYGCSRYVVQEGDEIQWTYTCDYGRDIGADWMEQNG